jgi:Cdc6-like AAA superfamily ATPase
MYLCGVPGTGKTLTTRQAISCLKDSVLDKLLLPFKFIDVNAFQVTEPHQIYKLIYKELTGDSVSAEQAVILLEKKFEQKSAEPTVLLIDEASQLLLINN